MTHAHSSHREAVVRLVPTRLPPSWLERALLTAVAALENARQRRALALLDRRLLEDIGLTREQAEAEVRKSAWRP